MYSTYPNPAKESLTIEKVISQEQPSIELTDSEAMTLIQNQQASMSRESEYSLYDRFGKKALTVKSSIPKTDLDLKQIPGGIYLLKITDDSKTITQRIVVDK
jgi:hypothetical protein